MRLVTLGILAAMAGAGCAFQAGDPGEPSGPTPAPATQLTTTQATPKIHAAASAAPPNPEPSPWLPTAPAAGDVGMSDQGGTGQNPEPSPWVPDPPSEGAGKTTNDPGNAGSGGGSTTGNSGGSTPNQPNHTH
jgi:hypothetical protein